MIGSAYTILVESIYNTRALGLLLLSIKSLLYSYFLPELVQFIEQYNRSLIYGIVICCLLHGLPDSIFQCITQTTFSHSTYVSTLIPVSWIKFILGPWILNSTTMHTWDGPSLCGYWLYMWLLRGWKVCATALIARFMNFVIWGTAL